LGALDEAARARLATTIGQHDCAALVVVASTSSDPDLAPFVRGARLSESCLLADRNGEIVLGYFTPMERDEARSTGLEATSTDDLGRSSSAVVTESASSFGGRAGRLLRHLLENRGWRSGRVALAGSAPAGDVLGIARVLETAGFEVTSGTALSRRWRRAKSGWQLEDMRRAAAATCEAMRKVAATLADASIDQERLRLDGRDLRIADLQREVALVLAAAGLEQPEGQIISTGAVAGVPHSRGDPETVLRAGETIVVDLFPRSLLFADCTRTFVVPPVSDEVQSLAKLVRRALDGAKKNLRVGTGGLDLQDQTCAVFEEAGFPTLRSAPKSPRGYVHGLGHGVGFELHELPSFRADGEDGTIHQGDVVTVEPGLYDPKAGFGIRLEDLLWMGPDGPENLTPLPYAVDPSLWPRQG
jgi:Xaa-Pro aminopeptidase